MLSTLIDNVGRATSKAISRLNIEVFAELKAKMEESEIERAKNDIADQGRTRRTGIDRSWSFMHRREINPSRNTKLQKKDDNKWKFKYLG
jgi:hypothetical protein